MDVDDGSYRVGDSGGDSARRNARLLGDHIRESRKIDSENAHYPHGGHHLRHHRRDSIAYLFVCCVFTSVLFLLFVLFPVGAIAGFIFWRQDPDFPIQLKVGVVVLTMLALLGLIMHMSRRRDETPP
ncbi:hypothetical protein [Cellulomonas septica]|uniref:Uncharacterized protein n=1 Tax=Cellulomonas septica TaxID=285080 RepID=A0ABX1JWK1_9CELL|nr:hypothetical protein [Cellulomonas septica]NKY38696.1 hypothetical protein [Cellulomonas septica]